MKHFNFFFLVLLVGIFTACGDKPNEITISKDELMNKIKGGWAGQAIGVCYALPTEFRYRSRMIPDSIQLELTGEQLKKRFNNDDLYVDAKFIEVISRLGFDAPADSFAMAFANAGFTSQHSQWNNAPRIGTLEIFHAFRRY